HPPVLALGIGCERGCDAAEIAGLAQDCLADAGFAAGAVAAVVSVDLKVDEPGIQALAASLGVPARFFPAARLLDETARLTVRSRLVGRCRDLRSRSAHFRDDRPRAASRLVCGRDRGGA